MSLKNTLLNNIWSSQENESLKSKDTEYSKDKLVSSVLNILSNRRPSENEKTFADEIKTISNITEVISKNIANGTITEKQGELLLKYLFSNLLSRRVSKIFENLGPETSSYNWVVAASKSTFMKEKPKSSISFSKFELTDD